MAKELVAGKLAACVTVFPGVTSHFFWKGELSREKEAMILVKTTKEKAGKVIKKIKEIHKYQLPEILFFQPAGGEKRYLDWVKRSLGGK
jgi:periplasmic divalent cation tolerance protein